MLKIYLHLLQAVPSILFALLAGPWSDVHGRKLLLISSMFGFVFNNAVFMINTYWFYDLKAEFLLFEVSELVSHTENDCKPEWSILLFSCSVCKIVLVAWLPFSWLCTGVQYYLVLYLKFNFAS